MKIKTIWKDPVGSKLIATAIITSVAGLITYLTGLWPTFYNLLLKLLRFVVASSSIPNWMIGLMAIPCLMLLASLVLQVFNSLNKKEIYPEWVAYNKDIIFDVLWRWSYDPNGKIVKIFTFCPKCDLQLIEPIHNNAYDSIEKFNYFCEECGHKGEDLLFYPDEIHQKIKLKIQKNIRTGDWKNIV